MSLAACDGQTLVILGPSGAGKTSLLRLLCGLEVPDSGRVLLDGGDVTHLSPDRRGIALVTQHDSLFPHLTIYENLAFAMRLRRTPANDVDRSVHEYAALFDIERHLSARPAFISGGERQRAALARAILANPRVLLLDEPFAHLDPQLRVYVRKQFASVRRRFAGPVLQVTHDHSEAAAGGDRLAIMMDGRIVQYGSPQDVYDFPATIAVAAFFGSPPMNLLDAGTVIEGIRPEHACIDAAAALRGVVEEIETTGPDSLVTVHTSRGRITVRVPVTETGGLPARGDETGVAFNARFVRRYDRATGKSIA